MRRIATNGLDRGAQVPPSSPLFAPQVASKAVRFALAARELPTELLEETRSAINHIVGLQLRPSQWSVVDARFHQIDWATEHDDAAALTEALHNLAHLEAGSHEESVAKPERQRQAEPVDKALGPPPPLMPKSRGATSVARVFPATLLTVVAVAVLGLLGVFTVSTLPRVSQPSALAPPETSSPETFPTLPSEPAEPLGPQPPFTRTSAPTGLSTPPATSSGAPAWRTPPQPRKPFHAGSIALVLGGALLAMFAAALIAVLIRRRRSRTRGAAAERPPMSASVLDAPVDIEVPPPWEIRESLGGHAFCSGWLPFCGRLIAVTISITAHALHIFVFVPLLPGVGNPDRAVRKTWVAASKLGISQPLSDDFPVELPDELQT